MTFVFFASRIEGDILNFQVKAFDHSSLLSYLFRFGVSLCFRGLNSGDATFAVFFLPGTCLVLRVGFLTLESFFSHLWILFFFLFFCFCPFPTADHSVKLRRRCYEDEVPHKVTSLSLIADGAALTSIFALEGCRIDSSKLALIMCLGFPLSLSYTQSTKAYPKIHSLSPPSITRKRVGSNFHYAWYGILMMWEMRGLKRHEICWLVGSG
jgi:hypothetical protein